MNKKRPVNLDIRNHSASSHGAYIDSAPDFRNYALYFSGTDTVYAEQIVGVRKGF